MMPSAPHAALWRAKAAELAVAAYSVPAGPDVVHAGQRRPPGEPAAGLQRLRRRHRREPPADPPRLRRQRPAALALRGLRPAGAAAGAGGDVPRRRARLLRAQHPQLPGGRAQPGRPPARPSSPPAARATCPAPTPSTTRRATTGARSAEPTSSASTPTRWSTGSTSAPPAGRPPTPSPSTSAGQRALVASSGTDDGRTYSVDPAVAAKQDTYPGREEYAAQSLASAWLALYVRQIGVPLLDRGTLAVPGATAKAPRAPAAATTLAP